MRSRRRPASTIHWDSDDDTSNSGNGGGGGGEGGGGRRRRRTQRGLSDHDDDNNNNSHHTDDEDDGDQYSSSVDGVYVDVDVDDHHSASSSSQLQQQRQQPPQPTPQPRVTASPWQSFFSPRPRQTPHKLHLSEESDDNGDGGDSALIPTAVDERCYSTGEDERTIAEHHAFRSGLHHRHKRNDTDGSTTNLALLPPSPYRITTNNNNNPQQSPLYRGAGAGGRRSLIHPAQLRRQFSWKQTPHNNNIYDSMRWWLYHYCFGGIQSLLLVVAVLYLFLVIHVYHRVVSDQQQLHNNNSIVNHHDLVVLQYQMEKRRLARSYLEHKQEAQIQTSQQLAQARAEKRRQFTRPPPIPPSYVLSAAAASHSLSETVAASVSSGYTILRGDSVDIATITTATATKTTLKAVNKGFADGAAATMEDLCGYFAQNASLSVPRMYPRRDALGGNNNNNSPPRVLVTGILNPLGFHLALTLHERCGVGYMVGIDYMFPNTVASRLEKLVPMQILSTRLEGVLHKPILTANMAMDPKSGLSQKAVFLESTGQLDLVKTFQPTHIVHLASYAPEVYMSPFQNENSPYTSPDHPSMYSLRSSLTAMEQILSSIAEADELVRPHFVYVSSPLEHAAPPTTKTTGGSGRHRLMHQKARLMDELLAEAYYAKHEVYSAAIRIPNAVFGPWEHVESATYKIIDAVVAQHGKTAETNEDDNKNRVMTAAERDSSLDIVYVGDVVEGIVASMQFRPPKKPRPIAFELSPLASISSSAFQKIAGSLLTSGSLNDIAAHLIDAAAATSTSTSKAAHLTRLYLEWDPSTSLRESLIRTLAWHLDQKNPHGMPPSNKSSVVATGDALLELHSLPTCSPDDFVCHMGLTYLPCASECSTKSQCVTSIFDSMVSTMHEVLEGCDVVLYTHVLGNTREDLTLETEYMEEGNPLVCTVAFVSFESPFVQTVVKRVPDAELAKLGVTPRHEDGGTPEGIHKLKHKKLNGRLLYLGWLLVWPDDEVPDRLSQADSYLLKLSPGRLFPPEVQYSVFIEQSFGASPRIDDVHFLVNSMIRAAVPGNTVKSKTAPKTKFRLPPEPKKRAVIFLSELRRQESSKKSDRLPSDAKISVRQASRFMRFESGEDPVGRESFAIKQQREFYERATNFMNNNVMRSPTEPLHKFEFRHLARTRWVVHDMQADEGRQLRCDWYHEHVQWNSNLDQLSFAFVMAKGEIERRIAHEELDDRARMSIADITEMKMLLTDVFEWHPLRSEVNRHYSPLTEIQAAPLHSEEDVVETDETATLEDNEPELLFARIISDRYLSTARKNWNRRTRK